jgi:histidyl-tRNA synthetase
VVILGPDEVKAGQIVVKNLRTGEQQAYTESEATEMIEIS